VENCFVDNDKACPCVLFVHQVLQHDYCYLILMSKEFMEKTAGKAMNDHLRLDRKCLSKLENFFTSAIRGTMADHIGDASKMAAALVVVPDMAQASGAEEQSNTLFGDDEESDEEPGSVPQKKSQNRPRDGQSSLIDESAVDVDLADGECPHRGSARECTLLTHVVLVHRLMSAGDDDQEEEVGEVEAAELRDMADGKALNDGDPNADAQKYIYESDHVEAWEKDFEKRDKLVSMRHES
jgi:hypothetical protein